MAFLFDPGAILGALSGVAMAGLGAAVLRIRPWRPSALAFSAFAALWGLQVVAANVGQMAADPETALPWARLFVLLAIPVYAPLLGFVALHGRRVTPERAALLALSLGAPALVLVVLYVAEPALYVAGTRVNAAGLVATEPGPLFAPVLLATNVLAFAFALVVVARRLARAIQPVARAQLALLAATLAIYVSYRAADVLRAGSTPLRLGSAALAFFAVAALALHAARHRDLPWRGLMLGACVAPFAVGALEARVVASGVWGFNTVGVWRLAMVALLAYALARYSLFDVELKLAALAPAAAQLVASLFGLDLVWSFAFAQFAGQPFWATLASAGVALALAPTIRVWRMLARRIARNVGTESYASARKLEVYRAALAQATADGRVDEREASFLAALRRDLGISEDDHVRLANLTKGAAPA